MGWVAFALMAPAFWAMNVVTFKFLVDKRFKKPLPFAVLIYLIDLIFVVGVLVLMPVGFLFPYSVFALLAGLMTLFAFWFYYKAAEVEEISRISSLSQTIPIFVAVLSAIFLGEILVFRQYVGIAFIVIASMLISYRKIENVRRMSPALKYVVAFTLTIALYSVIGKYLLNYINYWSLFFWNAMGTTISIPILLVSSKIRKDFLKIVSNLDKKALALGVLLEALWFLGTISSFVALSIGYVSLVSSIAALEPLFVLVYTTALSLFIPRILKEEVSRFNVAQKLFSILLIFIGMWMLNIF